jgi:glycosyltransferase involved in cell wall biosynthesis
VDWTVVGDSFADEPNVDLVSPVSPPSMPALMRSVDVVVMPSLYDSFGIVGAEAMMCAVPVVTSATGFGELLADEGGGGWVISEPTDIDGFQSAIESILGDASAPDTARQLRARVLPFVDPGRWSARVLQALGIDDR